MQKASDFYLFNTDTNMVTNVNSGTDMDTVTLTGVSTNTASETTTDTDMAMNMGTIFNGHTLTWSRTRKRTLTLARILAWLFILFENLLPSNVNVIYVIQLLWKLEIMNVRSTEGSCRIASLKTGLLYNNTLYTYGIYNSSKINYTVFTKAINGMFEYSYHIQSPWL